MNSYQEFLSYLNEKAKIGMRFGLENISLLLQKLDNPHKKLHVIHIAGTNGKGSVAAMLSAILTAAGLKVGLYTSPHLVNVRERIRLNENDISEADMLATAKRIAKHDFQEITYFEFITAAAFNYFNEQKVDIAIMETGMGGRLDATNVCDAMVAIITDISIDHAEYLGDTIEKIRKEKMAIIKKNSISVLAEDLGTDFEIEKRELDFQTISIGERDDIKLNLLGDHQARNCALALKTIDVLIDNGYKIPVQSIYFGLKNVRWPARFQILNKDPLVVLDGAHNPAGAKVLADTISKYLNGKVSLIIGILKDKDYEQIVDILKESAKNIYAVTPRSERALSGDFLAGIIMDKPVQYVRNVDEALEIAEKYPPVVIAGSLYLAGEVLESVNSKL